MMEQILLKVIVLIQMIITAITGIQEPTQDLQPIIGQLESVADGIGTATFDPRAGGVYRLKAGITSSQTTIPLTSFKFPTSDNEITLSSGEIGYGTIEPGSATNKEFVSFTGVTQNADGSATLTGVTRGFDFLTSDITASTTLQKAHSGGSQFILSDSPQFFGQFLRLNNVATSTAFINFASTTPPRYDMNPTWGGSVVSSTTLVSKGYADDLAIAGAPDASQTVKGIVEEATQKEIASSTSSGGTTAPMFIRNTNSTTTPDLSTGSSQNNWVVVSNNDGYLHADWFGAGIHVSTTTAFRSSTVAIEQLGTAPPFVVGDTGTSSPAFWITAKGDVRLATTTESDKWQLAVSGTTTTDRFHMPTNAGNNKVLTSNSLGAATWRVDATRTFFPCLKNNASNATSTDPTGWGANMAADVNNSCYTNFIIPAGKSITRFHILGEQDTVSAGAGDVVLFTRIFPVTSGTNWGTPTDESETTTSVFSSNVVTQLVAPATTTYDGLTAGVLYQISIARSNHASDTLAQAITIYGLDIQVE